MENAKITNTLVPLPLLCTEAPAVLPTISFALFSANINTAKKLFLLLSLLNPLPLLLLPFLLLMINILQSFDFADSLKESWGFWGFCGPHFENHCKNTIIICFRISIFLFLTSFLPSLPSSFLLSFLLSFFLSLSSPNSFLLSQMSEMANKFLMVLGGGSQLFVSCVVSVSLIKVVRTG